MQAACSHAAHMIPGYVAPHGTLHTHEYLA